MARGLLSDAVIKASNSSGIPARELSPNPSIGLPPIPADHPNSHAATTTAGHDDNQSVSIEAANNEGNVGTRIVTTNE